MLAHMNAAALIKEIDRGAVRALEGFWLGSLAAFADVDNIDDSSIKGKQNEIRPNTQSITGL